MTEYKGYYIEPFFKESTVLSGERDLLRYSRTS